MMTKAKRGMKDSDLKKMKGDLQAQRDGLREDAAKLSLKQGDLYMKEQALLEEANVLNRAAHAIEDVLEGRTKAKFGDSPESIMPNVLMALFGAFGFEVLSVLSSWEGGWASPAEIAKALGVTSTKVRTVLLKGVKRGICQRKYVNERKAIYRMVCKVEVDGPPEPKQKTEPVVGAKAPELPASISGSKSPILPMGTSKPRGRPRGRPKKAPVASSEPKRTLPARPRGRPKKVAKEASVAFEDVRMSDGRKKQLFHIAEKAMEPGRWYTAEGIIEAAISAGVLSLNADHGKAKYITEALKGSSLEQRDGGDGRIEFMVPE